LTVISLNSIAVGRHGLLTVDQLRSWVAVVAVIDALVAGAGSNS
jgi:hypothetical protein